MGDPLSDKIGGDAGMSILDWIFKRIVRTGRKVGWLVILGALFLVVGFVETVRPLKEGEEKRSAVPGIVLGVGLIGYSLYRRARRQSGPAVPVAVVAPPGSAPAVATAIPVAAIAPAKTAPEKPEMGLQETVRAGVRWVASKIGWWATFGGLVALLGLSGLLSADGRPMIDLNDKDDPTSPEVLHFMNVLFTVVGFAMIGLQIFLRWRRR